MVTGIKMLVVSPLLFLVLSGCVAAGPEQQKVEKTVAIVNGSALLQHHNADNSKENIILNSQLEKQRDKPRKIVSHKTAIITVLDSKSEDLLNELLAAGDK